VFFDPRRLLSFLSSCLSHVGSPLGRKDCQSGNLGRTLHWSGKRTEIHSLPTGDFWNGNAFAALEQEPWLRGSSTFPRIDDEFVDAPVRGCHGGIPGTDGAREGSGDPEPRRAVGHVLG